MMHMNKLIFILGIASFTAYAQDGYSSFTLEEFGSIDHIPEVLTATRLKQPKAETPASVTVISAEQIQALGARNIPEVLRFVPGMFVGHSQSESSDTVIYHASSQNFTRRLQVLIDGRSVYNAAVARVIWDNIPLAVEDINRIEIIRGPSSATYGANAFLATINIITKSPEESLGTQMRYRGGNNDIQDTYLSHSNLTSNGSYRITTSYNSDSGFDGEDAKRGEDNWNDDKDNKFVNLTLQKTLSNNTQLNLYAGVGNSYAEMDNSAINGHLFRDTDFGFVQSNATFNFSATHQSQLKIYWQKEKRIQEQHDSLPTVAFDPVLFEIFQMAPEATANLIDVVRKDPSNTNAIMQEAQNLPLAGQLLLGNLINDPNKDITETVSGFIDYNYTDQRFDIEWQDTVIWHDRVRTVTSLNYRHDEAYSKSMFNGRRYNDTFRIFTNAEWRITDWLLLNTAGTYEYEKLNKDSFSPRVALNWLLSDRQSLRFVYSEATRSPDMIEQQPNMKMTGQNLSPNYLGVTEATLYQTNFSAHRHLDKEEIKSYEIGYYAMLSNLNLELDVKLYKEYLTHLISDPINLDTRIVESNTELNISGIESQFKWQPNRSNWLTLTLAHMEFDNDKTDRKFKVETRLSPKDSATTSWHHKGRNGWSSTLSYLWLNSFDNGDNLYQRSELQLRKQWSIKKYRPWMSVFWQHQFAHNALGYYSQKYSTRDIYYLQAGINF